MKENFATCFVLSLSVCAGLLVFVLAATGLRRCAGEGDDGSQMLQEVVRDTVRDTVCMVRPAVRDSVVTGWTAVRAPRVKKELSQNVCADSLASSARTDSATVLLAMERKVYGDSAFRAVVSGVRVSLDSIMVYPRTITVTRTIPGKAARRWGIGIQSGVGLTPKGIQPYAGLGVYYRIF